MDDMARARAKLYSRAVAAWPNLWGGLDIDTRDKVVDSMVRKLSNVGRSDLCLYCKMYKIVNADSGVCDECLRGGE
jgi:hypothetical protein